MVRFLYKIKSMVCLKRKKTSLSLSQLDKINKCKLEEKKEHVSFIEKPLANRHLLF